MLPGFTTGGGLVLHFSGSSGGYVIQYPNSVCFTPLAGMGVGVGTAVGATEAVGVGDAAPPELPPLAGTGVGVGVAVTGTAVGVTVGAAF
ncbi:MAG TPA: hypothetical protein VMC84_01885 [Methanocella sp.]|uniref:hypothetical protein n=1 Tax=Methanocella sp. TaxID=2052833 RepID=UPI002B9669D9|nr:hypothetical protein [Methanocella sp.]HTY89904.1 hypothetical protein [Methanocella sp.]